MKLFQLIALGSALAIVPAMAQAPAPAAAAPAAKDAAKTAVKKEMKEVTPAPSAMEIADAAKKDMVWVNLNTKKYHHSGVATYGTTKRGKFMTEADAKAGGFEAAKEPMAAGAGKKAAKTADKMPAAKQ